MKTTVTKSIVHAPHLNAAPKRTPIGLGDAVKAILTPVTKAVDSAFGSKLTQCVPCNTTRKDFLNRIIPDITKPFKK